MGRRFSAEYVCVQETPPISFLAVGRQPMPCLEAITRVRPTAVVEQVALSGQLINSMARDHGSRRTESARMLIVVRNGLGLFE
jgi:hypothetical protein